MFHVFALVYLTIGFLWPILLFSTVLRAMSMKVYCNMNVYTITAHVWREYFHDAGHVTCSSSWACDRNFFSIFLKYFEIMRKF